MEKKSSFGSQNSKEPYAVVQFEGTDYNGKLCIDLVLKKWFTTRGKKNVCKYPPETHYHLRDQFLEKLKSPEKSWSCVPYTFIVGAENLEQGRRRLNRAQFTKDCQTTDNEKEKSAKIPSLSKSQINDILHDRVPMCSSSLSITETPTGKRLKSKSRISKRQEILSSDTDNEKENISSNSTYSTSPPKKSYKTSSFYLSKQSSSNREKFCANNTRKRKLFERNINFQSNSEDDTGNELINSSICNEKEVQYLTPPKEKTITPKDVQVSNEPTVDDMEPFQDLKFYIDKKLNNLRDRIGYDLKTKLTELKNTILGLNLTSAAGPNLTSTKTRLSVEVPIQTLDEFLDYETVLKNDKDEIEALRTFFRILIYSQTKANSCIAIIMTATLDKTVELEYSGFGRSVGGHSKKNFNNTHTCITMKEVIMDKLGEGLETLNLQSKISKWLSGAKDRKGGRKERQSEVRRRSRSA